MYEDRFTKISNVAFAVFVALVSLGLAIFAVVALVAGLGA